MGKIVKFFSSIFNKIFRRNSRNKVGNRKLHVQILAISRIEVQSQSWKKRAQTNLEAKRKSGMARLGLIRIAKLKSSVKKIRNAKLFKFFVPAKKAFAHFSKMKHYIFVWRNKKFPDKLTRSQIIRDGKIPDLFKSKISLRGKDNNITDVEEEEKIEENNANSNEQNDKAEEKNKELQDSEDSVKKDSESTNNENEEKKDITEEIENKNEEKVENAEENNKEEKVIIQTNEERLNTLKEQLYQGKKIQIKAKSNVDRAKKEVFEIRPIYFSYLEEAEVPERAIKWMKTVRYNPPELIKICLEGICVLKGIEPAFTIDFSTGEIINENFWVPSKKLLASNLVKELNELKEPGFLIYENLKQFEKNVLPQFPNRNDLDFCFPPSALLFDWIFKICDLGYITNALQEKENTLEDAENLYFKCNKILIYLENEISKVEKLIKDEENQKEILNKMNIFKLKI